MRKFVMVLSTATALLLSIGNVQASVEFSIEEAMFTDLNGNNESFTWSVTAESTSFSLGLLEVGVEKIFKYGTFSTTDFSFNFFDLIDLNDSFDVELSIMPPNPAAPVGGTGIPIAAKLFIVAGPDVSGVNFSLSNSPVVVNFGTGGSYEVEFLDTGLLFADGSLDLNAKITLLSEPANVPEPATFAVWCSLAGLAMCVNRRRPRTA